LETLRYKKEKTQIPVHAAISQITSAERATLVEQFYAWSPFAKFQAPEGAARKPGTAKKELVPPNAVQRVKRV
jgi:hypothetical protein